MQPYQPVAKVITAFDRPCIPADGVAIRAHTPGMHPNRALSGGRRNGLGARGTFTTDCYEHQEDNLGGEIFPATKQEVSHLQEADGNRLEPVSVYCCPRHRVSTVIGETWKWQGFGKERTPIPTPA